MNGNGRLSVRLAMTRLRDALCWATWAVRNLPYGLPYVFYKARGKRPILYDKAYNLYMSERLHSIDGYMGDGVSLSLASNCILSGYTPLWSRRYEEKAFHRRVKQWGNDGHWPFVKISLTGLD